MQDPTSLAEGATSFPLVQKEKEKIDARKNYRNLLFGY
tara:strand:- start:65 stop:178 length:114 start_codon:yes stop_codon:yes gene_type:complete